ncbi:MAG: RNA-binding domain-containing protein [Thermoplasmata archaeon]
MTFHYIEFLTYCHATEKPSKVIEAVENISGEGIELDERESHGHYGNPILIFTGKLERNREMKEVFKRFSKDDLEEILTTLEKRVDEQCNFFVRVDKGKAYEEAIVPSTGNYTIRLRARIESYPAKREKALKIAEDYIQELLRED